MNASFANACTVATQNALNIQAERDALKAEVDWLREDNGELNALFDLQHRRTVEATAWWQELTGKHDTSPDLGKLLAAMLMVIHLHDAAEEGFKAEVERLQPVRDAADTLMCQWTKISQYLPAALTGTRKRAEDLLAAIKASEPEPKSTEKET